MKKYAPLATLVAVVLAGRRAPGGQHADHSRAHAEHRRLRPPRPRRRPHRREPPRRRRPRRRAGAHAGSTPAVAEKAYTGPVGGQRGHRGHRRQERQGGRLRLRRQEGRGLAGGHPGRRQLALRARPGSLTAHRRATRPRWAPSPPAAAEWPFSAKGVAAPAGLYAGPRRCAASSPASAGSWQEDGNARALEERPATLAEAPPLTSTRQARRDRRDGTSRSSPSTRIAGDRLRDEREPITMMAPD